MPLSTIALHLSKHRVGTVCVEHCFLIQGAIYLLMSFTDEIEHEFAWLKRL